MTRTVISMSEIMRVGPWALRALGYPFGVAERATRLLAWTEAATGGGLALLRVGGGRILASTQAPALRRSVEPGFGRRLDAGGRCLFEIGPPAIDLVCADFRRLGGASLALHDFFGAALVPALAEIAAKRGESIVIVHRAGVGEIEGTGLRRDGWIAVTPAGPCFLEGDVERAVDALRGAGVAPTEGEALTIHRHIAAARTEDSAQRGYIGITAVSTPTSVAAITPSAAPYPQRVARAYREGLSVATIDLRHLYSLERETWAPTSERSRKQAGY